MIGQRKRSRRLSRQGLIMISFLNCFGLPMKVLEPFFLLISSRIEQLYSFFIATIQTAG